MAFSSILLNQKQKDQRAINHLLLQILQKNLLKIRKGKLKKWVQSRLLHSNKAPSNSYEVKNLGGKHGRISFWQQLNETFLQYFLAQIFTLIEILQQSTFFIQDLSFQFFSLFLQMLFLKFSIFQIFLFSYRFFRFNRFQVLGFWTHNLKSTESEESIAE